MISCYQTIAKFSAKGGSASGGKSKNGGGVYFVKQDKTGELSCNCKGWVYNRHCKHIDYVKQHPFVELDRIPTYQEAVEMVWGNDKDAKEKWVIAHLKEIVL